MRFRFRLAKPLLIIPVPPWSCIGLTVGFTFFCAAAPIDPRGPATGVVLLFLSVVVVVVVGFLCRCSLFVASTLPQHHPRSVPTTSVNQSINGPVGPMPSTKVPVAEPQSAHPSWLGGCVVAHGAPGGRAAGLGRRAWLNLQLPFPLPSMSPRSISLAASSIAKPSSQPSLILAAQPLS
ncbi:uncharacterized protein J3D65DRAFT_63558 [Phyllosticta citribraziliensis]|uniref:Uncharacterized protein n=1 Tax=Phyllosticta citribraziliensis TaxID=989973 RepID=A0ABR1LGI2_9PEZI